MQRRCKYPSQKNWSRYGGRGITYDASWEDFDQFVRDMGERPDGMTLERDCSDSNYSKDNCRWASWAEQARNRSNNQPVTFRGETRLLVEWSELLGINQHTLRDRIFRYGWDAEKALTTPVRRKDGWKPS
jgi:hypothetical protein